LTCLGKPYTFDVVDSIPYEIKRTARRRSIAIRIEPNGTVTVLAPRLALGVFIERFVRTRTNWIRRTLETFETYRLKNPPKEFTSGESFPVWGREARLDVIDSPTATSPSCELVDGTLRVTVPSAENSIAGKRTQGLLRDWYRRQTETKLRESLPPWAARMGVTPAKVTVANQTKRWGSCSSKGNLRFNWRLSMMPPSILDYVIVHELAHLEAHNHSKRFWDLVRNVLPDFKERRLWLRKNGLHLCL
jgi:predicted metal-dependent hydrolase